MTTPETTKSEGPAASAMLAAGVGALILGLLTTLAEASTAIKEWLTMSTAVGPLSGKTTYTVIGWLAAWAILHFGFSRRFRLSTPIVAIAAALLAAGFLGTFPIFFELFAGG